MDLDFIRTRITELRMHKGVSEYQMSLDLGMSKGYVQSISSGKALPSVKQLFSICEYFNLSPREFFDESPDQSKAQSAVWHKIEQLDKWDLSFVEQLMDHLIELRHE